MKILKRTVFAIAAVVLVFSLFYFLYMKPRQVVPVLMYHAVNSDENSSLNVSSKNFMRQMEFLSDNGYSVIPLKDLIKGIKDGKKFPPGTVVLTFDDGFEDNYLHAFPVLAKHNFPATIFLITGYVDNREGYLKWDQVRLMLKNNI